LCNTRASLPLAGPVNGLTDTARGRIYFTALVLELQFGIEQRLVSGTQASACRIR
jgi:hypothetical protein